VVERAEQLKLGLVQTQLRTALGNVGLQD
jgi:hypothetical protein